MNSNNRLVKKIVPTGRLEVACSAGDLVGRECFAREHVEKQEAFARPKYACTGG